MRSTSKRNSTRSQVWAETEATVRFLNSMNARDSKARAITGKVLDVGASGMFVETSETPANDADVDIEIRFDPGSKSSPLKLRARGKITRVTDRGMGIRFLSIDLARLQECIVKKMNRSPEGKTGYTLKSRASS